MNNTSELNVGPPPPADPPFPTVSAAVAALSTPENLARLALVAQKRLNRLACLPPGHRLRAEVEPMEFVHEAVRLVQTGEQHPGQGRNTRTRHLQNLASFFNFVQAVVQSCISAKLKRFTGQGDHAPIGDANADPSCVEPPSSSDVVREVQLRETERKLIEGLEQLAATRPSLKSAVALVQATALEDHRLPKAELSYKQVHEVRKRSRSVLREIAMSEGVPNPTGKEVLAP
jgi:hypothetical protein